MPAVRVFGYVTLLPTLALALARLHTPSRRPALPASLFAGGLEGEWGWAPLGSGAGAVKEVPDGGASALGQAVQAVSLAIWGFLAGK